jgi:hypothetical protein
VERTLLLEVEIFKRWRLRGMPMVRKIKIVSKVKNFLEAREERTLLVRGGGVSSSSKS